MPSQKQLKWSQLRVGVTVIFASLTLALLLFLMSGTTGLFSTRITLRSFFDNASGLRVGAPVRLSGVDIGNVSKIRVVSDKDKQITPVEVTMKVSTKYGFNLRRDSVTSLDTAGVPPTAHPLELLNVLRDDVPVPSLDRDEVLAMAPAAEDRRFRVPKILGEAP